MVEPSFGIDRILFSVLEHSFYVRPKDVALSFDQDASRPHGYVIKTGAPQKLVVSIWFPSTPTPKRVASKSRNKLNLYIFQDESDEEKQQKNVLRFSPAA